MKKSIIESILTVALSTGGDFSEVFIEKKKTNHITSSGGEIDDILSASSSITSALLVEWRCGTTVLGSNMSAIFIVFFNVRVQSRFSDLYGLNR